MSRRACATLLALSFGALLAFPAGAVRAAGFTTLRIFDNASEGSNPFAPLIQGTDGFLYGSLREQGSNTTGALFRINLNGKGFGVLTSFAGTNNGNNPEGALVQARDGNFYGTTFSGGANGYGTLFQITPDGQIILLTSFNNGNPGANPSGALLLGLDGNLYGTAEFGGSSNFGTVFRSTVPDGATTAISTFAGSRDGSYPASDLIQGTDGSFYGTTARGGSTEAGTIFRVTPDGQRQVLYSFTGNADGFDPLRGVVQGTDGNFYGIAHQGGLGSGGAIYRFTPSGALTTLYTFTPFPLGPYNSYGNLIQASDGNFYGVTYQGGLTGVGSIFRITPTGTFTEIYDFTGGTDGGYPRGGLVQASDGKLYGTTAGINGQASTLFQLDLDLPSPTPTVTLLQSSTVAVGDTIALAGNYFVGSTAVTFPAANNTTVAAASFTVRSGHYLEAVVPSGAITGPITVTANGRSGVSAASLTIGEIAPPPVPQMVTVIAQDLVASEAGANKGVFKIIRSGDTAQALTVIFAIGKKSTAINGVDYTLVTQKQILPTITRSVTIPAGKASVNIKVIPIDDAEAESDETVILNIKPGADYEVGSLKKAVVTIADND